MDKKDYILHLKYSNGISADNDLSKYKDFEDNKTLTRDMLPFFDDLTYIAVPRCVEKLGKEVFKGISFVPDFIGNSIKEIGESAFEDAKFNSFEIPKSVITIDKRAFAAENLKTITSFNTIPPQLDDDVFQNTHLENIFVPSSSENIYKQADGWLDYSNIIEAISE